MRLLLVIPARLASKRLAEKNLQRIGDHTLLGNAVVVAKAARAPDEVWVNTADEALAAEAWGFGARLYARNPALASDDTRTHEIMVDFVRAHPCDWLVAFNPTSPLVRPQTIDRFCAALRADACDTLVSVRPVRTHLLSETLYPLNFVPHLDPRTQDLPTVYAAAWALMGWRAATLAAGGGTWGGRVRAFVLPDDEAVDIDTQGDLDYARYLYDRRACGH